MLLFVDALFVLLASLSLIYLTIACAVAHYKKCAGL